MIRYKKIAFTCYAVTNMPKARKFYEGVLGLKLSRKLSNNFVEYDIGAGTLALGCAPGQWQPSKKGTSAALEVADFKGAVAHLQKRKIPFAIGPMDNPQCSMVGVRDPDGNMIVLHHRLSHPRKKPKVEKTPALSAFDPLVNLAPIGMVGTLGM